MPRVVTPLNDKQIKALKPKEKAYTKADGNGLQLLIKQNGTKLWEFLYKSPTLLKRRKTSFGTYPKTNLKMARNKRAEYITKIRNGIDPLDEKQRIKKQRIENANKNKFTFEKLSRALIEERLSSNEISQLHYKRVIRALENDAYPLIGTKPISEVTTSDIKSIISKVAKRGSNESARKLYYAISKTFKTLITRDNADEEDFNYQITNPPAAIDLKDLVGKNTKRHYPTITDDTGIKNLLLSIKEYQGETSTKNALLMLAYTFVRPTNARLALWSEINIKAKQWVIPAKKMKMRDEFIVPLSDRLLKLLKEIKLYSGDSPYLFPSTKSKTTPLSDGALLGAIRRMGYTKKEFTPHGFRAMFSTIAHEKKPFMPDVIEKQLAHSVGNSISQAYNRAEYLDERVKLMQWWSDYLDEVQND